MLSLNHLLTVVSAIWGFCEHMDLRQACQFAYKLGVYCYPGSKIWHKKSVPLIFKHISNTLWEM